MSIAAIVITFNRLELLKKTIDGLRKQTHKIDELIVVNNGSNDGTSEWLKENDDIFVVTQDNVGSSGGQYTAFNTAYERGHEWIWAMDDDVVPRPDCLSHLVANIAANKVVAPLRYSLDGTPFINDTIEFNLTNPFANIWKRLLKKEDLVNEIIPATGLTFEGPMFHRSLIEKIGLPEKKFFIFADDSEYMIRAKKAGFSSYIITKANLDRMLDAPDLNKEFSWKNYYIIRNIIAIDVLHGCPAVRVLRPFAYLISWLRKANSKSDRQTVIKAFKDGYFYKSEN
ncbi:MAG: glycosyltransferase [Candidatus Kapaibacterium sp.]